MDAQNLFPPADVRTADYHATVKSSRTQQRRIEHVRPVGGSHQNDALVGLEAIHLNQQLIQSLLALIVSAAKSGAPVTPYRIDFVNKNNAGGILLALLKQVAHPAGTNANEHFHEVGTGDRKERNICLPCNGSGQQGLAGTRRTY